MMVASLLDHKLGALLKAYLVDDPKIAEKLLSTSGSMGTFSSRVDSAYMLGLIGPKTHRDIHLIRKIRNEFGHSFDSIKFSDEKICSRCNEQFHFNNIESTSNPRKMFVKTTISILAILNSDLLRMEHRIVGKDLCLDDMERKKHIDRILKMAESLNDETREAIEQLLKRASIL